MEDFLHRVLSFTFLCSGLIDRPLLGKGTVIVLEMRGTHWNIPNGHARSRADWLRTCRWRITKVRRQSAFGISLDNAFAIDNN